MWSDPIYGQLALNMQNKSKRASFHLFPVQPFRSELTSVDEPKWWLISNYPASNLSIHPSIWLLTGPRNSSAMIPASLLNTMDYYISSCTSKASTELTYKRTHIRERIGIVVLMNWKRNSIHAQPTKLNLSMSAIQQAGRQARIIHYPSERDCRQLNQSDDHLNQLSWWAS